MFLPCRSCCDEPPCRQIEAEAGGAGTTVTTHTFPSDELDLQFDYQAYSVPDEFIVEMNGTVVYETGGQVSGTGKYCFTKPAGTRDIEVTVNGPHGTAWRYTLKCQCDPPPPPPGPCCVTSSPCNDGDGFPVTIGSCTGTQLDCCISDGNSESTCIGGSPPSVTQCQDGYETRSSPPYDCVAGDDFSSLQITFYGLDLTEISDEGPDYATLRTAVEGYINGVAWVFSSVCLSTVKESFPTIEFEWTDPYGTPNTIYLDIEAETSICNRYVILYISVTGTISVFMTREKYAITPTKYTSRCPINGVYELCLCSNFSGTWDEPAGASGTVDVRKA